MNVYQLTELPTDWKPDSLYFILEGDQAETYVTDDHATPKYVGNTNFEGIGASTLAELDDITSFDLPGTNIPLAQALAAFTPTSNLGSAAFVEADQDLGSTDDVSFGQGTFSGDVQADALNSSLGNLTLKRKGSTKFAIRSTEALFYQDAAPSADLIYSCGQASRRWSTVFAQDGSFSGNVGIGTDTPSEKLEVVGNVSVGNGITKGKLSVVGQNYTVRLVSDSSQDRSGVDTTTQTFGFLMQGVRKWKYTDTSVYPHENEGMGLGLDIRQWSEVHAVDGFFSGVVNKGDFTVATLPASPSAGDECNVTDSSVTTWGSTVAGGGSSHVAVRYNGTNWTVTGI